MSFRPYPVLTLLCLVLLGVLIWLGLWQVSRAEWKRGLVVEHEQALAADPVSLTEALCGGDPGDTDIIARKDVAAVEVPGAAVRMFGRGPDGEPGWRVLSLIPAPTCLGSDAPILVELSFDPLQTTDYPDGDMRTIERLVVSPWPAKGAFAAPNDPLNNDWHWFDAPALAEALDVPAINSDLYLAGASNAPAQLRTPPSRHLGYAATWFGMALALLVVYAAFHARAGRLRFGKSGAGPT